MKLADKYPFGSAPPYDMYNRLFCYTAHDLKCVVCGADTRWILISKHTAVCSTECDLKLVTQGVDTEQTHWLQS